MIFGSSSAGDLVPLHSHSSIHRYFKFQLAVDRVSSASGASEVFDEILKDDSDDSTISHVPVVEV